MWDAKIGMQVVCIESFIHRHKYIERMPIKGTMYTIRNIVDDSKGRLYLRFEELVNDKFKYTDSEDLQEMAFHSGKFRPVTKTSIDDLIKIAIKPPKEWIKDRPEERKWDVKRKVEEKV